LFVDDCIIIVLQLLAGIQYHPDALTIMSNLGTYAMMNVMRCCGMISYDVMLYGMTWINLSMLLTASVYARQGKTSLAERFFGAMLLLLLLLLLQSLLSIYLQDLPTHFPTYLTIYL